MQLSNNLAALIGFACEAVLWGADLPRRISIYNFAVYITLLIFLCCTTHFTLEFDHFYTTLNAVGVNNYGNETTQLSASDYLISFADFLGDLVLIYRCWLPWDRSYYIVVLPFLTALGGLVSAPLLPLLHRSWSRSLADYTLPLCTNVMVTFLIVLRIWVYSRTVGAGGVICCSMMLVVDLLFQLILVVLVAIQHGAEAIVAVTAVQIYGIAPTLIIILVSSERISGPQLSMPPEWSVRRGEESGTLTTNGLVTSTVYEGAKESDLSTLDKTPDKCELGDT